MALGNREIHMQKNEDGLLSYITKKINSKWIKSLSVSPETIKLLEKKQREKFHDIGLGNYLSDMTPKAQATEQTQTTRMASNLETLGQQRKQSTEDSATYKMKKNIGIPYIEYIQDS